MARPSAFRIVPWDRDFLEALQQIIAEATGNQPAKALLVFPQSRPGRYLTERYRQEGIWPLLLPRIMDAQELIAGCRMAWSGNANPLQTASHLERVGLLKLCVEEVAASLPPDNPLHTITGENGMIRFFPWGVRLAGVLEECFEHLVGQVEMLYTQDMVEPFAAALLEQLRHIREKYIHALAERGLTTPGRDAAFAAAQAVSRPPLPAFLQHHTLILAGFSCLSRAQDDLFKYLWQQGALVCLHTDPEVMDKSGHWSCSDHRDWIHAWKARCRLTRAPSAHKPHIHFFAGYDLHSQLQELEQVLNRHTQNTGSRAVVLPDSSLLMPTLHHVPHKDINIALGYPLERSLMSRLLDAIFRLRESRRENGRVHWHPFMELIRHPYVRMLRFDPDTEDLPTHFPRKLQEAAESGRRALLRPVLHVVEQKVRSGPRLLIPEALCRETLDDVLGDLDNRNRRRIAVSEADGVLLEYVLESMTTYWEDVTTLRQAAQGISQVCDVLLHCGRHIWPSFPLDAECVHRVMHNLIPSLEDSSLADEELPLDTIFAIVRQHLSQERVAFEAEPLTGLQLMGMQETRLLRFDTLYCLDMTEDRIPGPPRHDPLLPDSLRGLLGLPDTRQRDRLAAHNLRRLMAGSQDVYFFWQEGVETAGLMDAKKVRSRFVEEALWELEKARGKQLKPGEEPLQSAHFPLSSPPTRQHTILEKSEPLRDRMLQILAEPLSPTRLDSYVRCPVRFYYEYMSIIRPLEDVREDDDPLEVGKVLHNVLLKAYEPYVGKRIHPGMPEPDVVESLFHEEFLASGLEERLPAESWLMFKEAGPRQLRAFLRSQSSSFQLLQVEQKHQAVLMEGEAQRTLYGILDRVDARDEGEIILDYKSGGLPRLREAIWRDDTLWSELATWQPGRRDPLPQLADTLSSLQLPLYLYIYRKETGRNAVNAAWVPLGKGGEEVWLFSRKMDEEEVLDIVEHRLPVLFDFVLRHMEHAPTLTPRPGPHCEWCPYAGIC